MSLIATTPAPPYYAVIFTARRTAIDDGYGATVDRMHALAQAPPGFLSLIAAQSMEELAELLGGIVQDL